MKPRAAFKALAVARNRPDTPCCCLRFYGLSVSVWLRPIPGCCVILPCIVRSFHWLPVLAPPWRARGAVHAGGGFGRAFGAVGLMVVIRLSFPGKMGGLPVGVA